VRSAVVCALVALTAAGAGCDHPTTAVSDVDPTAPLGADREIVPGERVGPVRLGMRYDEVRALLGEADVVAFARYPALGLEVVLTTPVADAVVGSARVIAIGVRGGRGWSGPARPGETREAIERELGAPDFVGKLAFYARGASVEYAMEGGGDVAAVAVYSAYTDARVPPPMGLASP
jgi:hypothetical protein